MTKQSFIATSGITLRTILLKEDDQRIVTLFTREMGIASFVAKKIDAKDQTKKILTSLLIKAEFVLSKTKSDLCKLIEGKIEDPYLHLRENLASLQAAGKMANAILLTQLPGRPQKKLFDLLAAYLQALKQFPYPETLLASFYLKLLRYEGLLPVFDECEMCHKNIPERFFEKRLCCKECALATAEKIEYEDLQVLAILTHATQFSQMQEIPLSGLVSKIAEELFSGRQS
ncbi:MAG: DNA repair protein RecO [Chlamydiae bacterium]|nr:DNA repair protein RecO [Chlamydiota bacterium]